MKITGKKDIAAERLRGRAAIDAVYVPRINAAMGPKFALYQAKAFSASNEGALVFSHESEAVLEKWNALLDGISTIESERQTIQARIDAATTASEIDAIVASI